MEGLRGLPPRTGQTLTGMVKSYNRKGFGFIMCQAIDQDIYFSRESLHPQLQTSDLAGENVTFEIHKFPDGKLQARNLRAVGDVSDFRGGGYGGSRRPPPPPPRVLSAVRSAKEEEDRSRDWYCVSCGERNFVKRSECFKCKSLRPRGDGEPPLPVVPGPPRGRTLSPHAGSRAMREMHRQGMMKSRSRSKRKKREKRRRSRSRKSSSSSSSSGSRKRSKKRSSSKKKESSKSKSRSRSSSARSVSSSSESNEGKPRASSVSAMESELQDSKRSPEIEKAKAEVLEKLMKLREVEPREARVREWRALLREWHPDKNPERVEVATAVFQFLQKGKLLIDAAK